MNASIHLRTNALQGVPGASAAVRGKVAAGSVAPAAASLASRAEKVAAVAAPSMLTTSIATRGFRPKQWRRRAPSA